MQETLEMQFRSLGWEDPLEEETATHFSILARKISWTEEPGGLQSIGSQRVRHNCLTETTHKYSRPITSLSFCYSLLLAMLLRLFISFISQWQTCYNGVHPAQYHVISKSQSQKPNLPISMTPICLSLHFSNHSSYTVCIRYPSRG